MRRGLGSLLLVVLFLVGCRSAVPTPPVALTEGPRELRVMAYSSFNIGEDVIAQFEAENNARVRFLDAGDTGQMISQVILSRDDPQADVIYGIDNTFLSRALQADILLPYKATALDDIPEAFKLDDQYRVAHRLWRCMYQL